MNTHIENFLKAVEKSLPAKDLVAPKDLVNAGLIGSANSLCRWRDRGYGPAFINVNGRIWYVRASVLEWLRQISYESATC